MSEVKRYGHIGYLVNANDRLCELYPDMTVYVKASDYDAAQVELAALREELAQKVVLAVRDICELEPADNDDPECICIKASDLGAILSRYFEGAE